MKIVAYLDTTSIPFVMTALSEFRLEKAESWEEISALVADNQAAAVLVGPTVDGYVDVEALLALLNQHPLVPFFAFLALHPSNLRPILRLSQAGLAGVFFRPVALSAARFVNAVESAIADRFAFGFLKLIEARVGFLDSGLSAAVLDLFKHPRRYISAGDLAVQARLPYREVYRGFSRVGLGSPARLVKVAKVLRGYWYLQYRNNSISEASRKLGYPTARLFSVQFRDIVQCQPSRIRPNIPPPEIVMQCAEWLSKPKCASENHPKYSPNPVH
jgi:AraC-like DNA-binding protein